MQIIRIGLLVFSALASAACSVQAPADSASSSDGSPEGAANRESVAPAADGTYKGREIANVMSYRGASWLERDSRPAEEDPDALLAALPLGEGDTAVDMGCGSGYYARRLSVLVGASGTVLCVDIQPEMIALAERNAEEAGLSNIEFILSEPDDPRLAAGSVDLILLVDVYHEFADPAPMLEAMRKALRPGGVAALAEYRMEGSSASWILAEHRMSVDQVKAEWLPAGFELLELVESLPSQHLFLFSPKAN